MLCECTDETLPMLVSEPCQSKMHRLCIRTYVVVVEWSLCACRLTDAATASTSELRLKAKKRLEVAIQQRKVRM